MMQDGVAAQEAHARNQALTRRHGRIPSYVLWREMDIHAESVTQRARWWAEFAADDDKGTLSEVTLEVEKSTLGELDNADSFDKARGTEKQQQSDEGQPEHFLPKN